MQSSRNEEEDKNSEDGEDERSSDDEGVARRRDLKSGLKSRLPGASTSLAQ